MAGKDKDKLWDALMFAVSSNNIESIRAILARKNRTLFARKKIDVNKQDEYGMTALMSAAFRNSESVKALLAHEGIDVNIQNRNGNTALMFAVHNSNSESAKALLAHKGIDVNKQDKDGNTALMLAEQSGNREAIKILSEYISENSSDPIAEFFKSYPEDFKEKISNYNPEGDDEEFDKWKCCISYVLPIDPVTIKGLPQIYNREKITEWVNENHTNLFRDKCELSDIVPLDEERTKEMLSYFKKICDKLLQDESLQKEEKPTGPKPH